jgi:hypothetical protein
MVRALRALYDSPHRREHVAIACLIVCYVDAMASHGGEGKKGPYLAFLRANLKSLCAGLDGLERGKDGAQVFYEFFRNELVHTFFSRNPKYAIAEDHELGGAYVGSLPVPGRQSVCTAVNIDRLYKDFWALARRKAKGRSL